MKRFLITLAMVVALVVPACAAQEVMLYNGDLDADGSTLSAWGSGYISETYETFYVGPRVLRVLSQGYYQGGVLSLKQPLNWGTFTSDSDAYLELLLKPAMAAQPTVQTPPAAASRTATPATGGRSASPSGSRGGAMGGARGSMAGRGAGSMARRSGSTGGARAAATRVAAPKAQQARPTSAKRAFLTERLRVVLVTDNGSMVADGWPLRQSIPDRESWKRIAIPLSAFKSTALAKGSQLKGLQLFSDRADIFYVGQIRLVINEQPIRVKARLTPEKPKVDQKVTFEATVESGGTPISVAWDFDETNGIQADVSGKKVEWIYGKPGIYTVTCTASDVGGSKTPAKTTLRVIVIGAP